jgi:hypothetical protein
MAAGGDMRIGSSAVEGVQIRFAVSDSPPARASGRRACWPFSGSGHGLRGRPMSS